MNRTNIEWAKNPDGTQGYTWNPITGCLNNDNGLCKGGGFPCYAYKLANTRLKQRYLANPNVADASNRLRDPNSSLWDTVATDPFYPRFWERKLDQPFVRKRPSGIFVCDMGDLFGIGIPKDWAIRILDVIRQCPQHRFYLLTKQPQNLIKFSPFPENCWVGVTATDNDALQHGLIYLPTVEAKVKYISFEPLLNRIIFPTAIDQVDWLIIGACTSQDHWELEAFNYHHDSKLQLRKWGKRWTLQPRIEDLREIVEAADKVGVKMFLKDNLKPLLVTTKDNNEYAPLWANGGYGTLRQELP